LFSEDTGKTWNRQSLDVLPEGKTLNDIFAINRNEVWAAGTQSLVLRTTDSGSTWEIIDLTDIASNSVFSCISVYEDTIWLSGENGLIVSSNDDGESWMLHDLPAGATDYLIQGIHAINESLIYAVGNKSSEIPGLVLRTVDGGLTWENIDLPNNYNENAWIGVKATDKNHIVIFGQQGHCVITANG
jgi:photosystem II stability/assembly factor-like uncharacterized protein